MKNKILIVEDDREIARSLAEYLRSESFEVDVAQNAAEFQKLKLNYDLLIMDWMLPDGQGIDLLKQIRAQKQSGVPVIFLTAKSDLIDKVLGLESGAQDYLTKPFDRRELLARVRVHLRDAVRPVLNEIEIGSLKVILAGRELYYNGRLIETTRKEFDLILLLMQNPNSVFTRDELLNKVWGFENFPTTRTVDTHILQLRQKTHEDMIQTVRGVGYRLKTGKELTST